MRRPAVFFDRDNTLIVGNDYLGDSEGVVLVAGAAAAVAQCRRLGYAVVVVSNQSGVARGMFGEDAVQAVNRRLDEMLLAADPHAVVDRHEYCPFHPAGTVPEYARDSDLRKPKPGMLYAAAEAMALDLPASWLIGDAPRDVDAGRAAGCRTILIIDPTLPPSPAALAPQDRPADFTVGSLVEAVEVVTREANRPAMPATLDRTPPPPPPGTDVSPTPAAVSTTTRLDTGTLTTDAVAAVLTPVRPPAGSPTDGSPRPASRPAVATTPNPPRPPATERQTPRADAGRLEPLNQQILLELKKLNETRSDDFSLSKLIAGIVQTLALAALPVAYVLYRTDPDVMQQWLLVAIFLQAFTVALLIMGRQR